MPASSSYTAATATANANAGFRGPPHNESTLRRASADRHASAAVSDLFFSPSLAIGGFSLRRHRALLSRRPSSFLLFSQSRCSFTAHERERERHLMKCHRCPTDCRVKCRRLLIPRLFLRPRGAPRDFDFARRNVMEMTWRGSGVATRRDTVKLRRAFKMEVSIWKTVSSQDNVPHEESRGVRCCSTRRVSACVRMHGYCHCNGIKVY